MEPRPDSYKILNFIISLKSLYNYLKYTIWNKFAKYQVI